MTPQGMGGVSGGVPGVPGGAGASRDAMLIEVAWEVCNKIGGIYQVLRSKAPAMVDRWRDRYCLIGPYVPSHAALEFEPKRPAGRMARVLTRLAEEGVRAHFGRWLVSGNPRVLLLEHDISIPALDELKYKIWKDFGVDIPSGDPTVDGVISFSEAVRKTIAIWQSVLEKPSRRSEPSRLIVHAHEWMGGLAIPMLRRDRVPVATVFTTHATILGRYMAPNEDNLYEIIPKCDPTAQAKHYAIATQHAIERNCARSADVFTTVSPITAEECTHLLGRTPEVILPNGLNMDRYDVGHEVQTLHAEHKQQIHRFVMGHFFPSYSFDLDRTLFMFTSGRFEPGNKGFDLCLDAMARLNTHLKSFDLGVTVVFFIITQRPTRSIHPRALQSRGVLSELEQVCARILREVNQNLVPRAAAGESVKLDDMVSQYWALRYRRIQHAFRTTELPMVTTHAFETDHDEPILSQIRAIRLFNDRDDPVKIVYHPEFISPVNPLWGMDYEHFVRGCHLGVFPSAYEPWGYTPLECIASGVPAITSDLAGFGRYVQGNMPDHDSWGVNVLKRRGRSFNDASADLARWLLAFCRLDRRGRINMRNRVVERAMEFDWHRFGQHYHHAHDLAASVPLKKD